MKFRLEELDSLDDKIILAQQSLELYPSPDDPSIQQDGATADIPKRRGTRPCAKKTNHWAAHLAEVLSQLGGPLLSIERVFEGGAYLLIDNQGNRVMPPVKWEVSLRNIMPKSKIPKSTPKSQTPEPQILTPQTPESTKWLC